MSTDKVNRFKFGGHDLTDLLKVNPTRSFAPPTEVVTVSVRGLPGARFVRTEMQPLEIPVHVALRMEAADHEAVALRRREIAAILVSDEPKPLVLPDEPTRYYLAVLSEAGELDTLWHTGSADLTFIAPDPIAYGAHVDDELRGGPQDVFVEGSWETRPVLTLEATGDALSVSSETADAHISLAEAPRAGAVVVIDMDARTVAVDGETVAIDLGSDYFALQPGTNRMDVAGATGAIGWEERWL